MPRHSQARASQNLVLEHLRAIRADLAEVKLDVCDIKTRLSSLERGQASIEHRLADMVSSTLRSTS